MAVLPVAAISFGMALGSRDRFGDGLQLPEGIELSEPLKEASDPAAVPDPFQAALKAALKAALNRPGSENAPLTASVPSLEILRRDAPDLLERYLAAHPGWHLHERQGSRFATRRWMVGDRWQMSLHGYYSEFNERDGPKF